MALASMTFSSTSPPIAMNIYFHCAKHPQSVIVTNVWIVSKVGIQQKRKLLDKLNWRRGHGRRPVTDIEVMALTRALKVSVAWLLKEADASFLPGC